MLLKSIPNESQFNILAPYIPFAEVALLCRNGHDALRCPLLSSLTERAREPLARILFCRRFAATVVPRALRPPNRRRPAAARNPFAAALAKSLRPAGRAAPRVFANRPNAVVFLVLFGGRSLARSKWTQ